MPALDRLTLTGFKSIKTFDLELRPINVLIGQNGAGKSNFISFFRMMSALTEQRLQEYVAKSGGANALLHYGQKTTDGIRADMSFGEGGYLIELSPTEEDEFIFTEDEFIFTKEEVRFEGDKGLYNVVGHKESLANRDLQGPERFHRLQNFILSSIRGWKVYHFHDTSSSAPVKKTGDIHDNEFLRPNAENLAAFLYLLQEKHPEHYALIRATVQRTFPRFGDFLLRPNPLNEDTIRLEWKEKGSDYRFGPHQISDGTLRFMGLATLLLQPNLPSTVLIDEPELGLHPAALSVLGGLVRNAATRTQVILTTQSVTFLNEFEPEDIVTVDRENGESVFRRHSTAELAAWLEDYSLAEIWEKNIIGGRP